MPHRGRDLWVSIGAACRKHYYMRVAFVSEYGCRPDKEVGLGTGVASWFCVVVLSYNVLYSTYHIIGANLTSKFL